MKYTDITITACTTTLNQLMSQSKPCHNEKLILGKTAEAMELSAHQLSELVNCGYVEVNVVDGENSMIGMVTDYENWIFPQTIYSVSVEKVIKIMHQFVIQDLQAKLIPKAFSHIEMA